MTPVRSAVSLRAKKLLADVFKDGSPAASDWDQVFQAEEFSSEVMADVLLQLHQKELYDNAVDCLLAALRNDHAQPWIYDVLAIEMKLAKRPALEIERALQSRTDFAGGDPRQQMITAAMLARFDAGDQAMAVLRRVVAVAPETSDAWLQARSIADKFQSPVDQVWARCGIIRHVWTDDFEKEHAEANQTIAKIAEKMQRAGAVKEASQAREDLMEASKIDLRIVVEWIGQADLDLIVDEPNGQQCNFKRRLTPNGGRLIRVSNGVEANSGRHREEYICRVAPAGNYKARLRFVYGKVVNGSALVQITHHEGRPTAKSTRTVVPLTREDAEIPVLVEPVR